MGFAVVGDVPVEDVVCEVVVCCAFDVVFEGSCYAFEFGLSFFCVFVELGTPEEDFVKDDVCPDFITF